MAALAYVEVGILIQFWPAPVVGAAHLGEALPVVELGNHVGCVHDTLALVGHMAAQLLKQRVLQAFAFVRCRQQLFFQLFEFHRGKALCIGKALAADKMEGRWPAVRRARDLIIIAKHTVKAQFELADARLGLFVGQHGLQLLLAVFGKVEQSVKLGVETVFEQAAFGDDCGRAVHKGALQQGRAVVHVVP